MPSSLHFPGHRSRVERRARRNASGTQNNLPTPQASTSGFQNGWLRPAWNERSSYTLQNPDLFGLWTSRNAPARGSSGRYLAGPNAVPFHPLRMPLPMLSGSEEALASLFLRALASQDTYIQDVDNGPVAPPYEQRGFTMPATRSSTSNVRGRGHAAAPMPGGSGPRQGVRRTASQDLYERTINRRPSEAALQNAIITPLPPSRPPSRAQTPIPSSSIGKRRASTPESKRSSWSSLYN